MLDLEAVPASWASADPVAMAVRRDVQIVPDHQPPRLSVLIAVTDHKTRALVEQAFRSTPRHEATITTVTTRSAALFALASAAFDVVVTDEAQFDLLSRAIGGDDVMRVIVGPLTTETVQAAQASGWACLAVSDLRPRTLQARIDRWIAQKTA